MALTFSWLNTHSRSAPNSLRSALRLAFCATLLGACSSSSPNGAPDSNGAELVGSFTVSLISAAVEGGINPPYTEVVGEVDDGPYPELTSENKLPAPADATPGCAVYGVVTPSCVNIGGCSTRSSNAACAAAAVTGVNACVCVATDTCQAYPSRKDVGDVSVSGVRTTAGAQRFQLTNLGNSYIVDPNTTELAFPAFAEGDPIEVSASGADYPAFQISATGVAPLTLGRDDYRLEKDLSDPDPTHYKPLSIEWNPPDSTDSGRVEIELNISRHAGTIGFLACDVEDTGSVTISAGLVSQLVMLGNIAGFPELNVTRSSSGSTKIQPGRVDLIVRSNVERFITIEGFDSCLLDSQCPSGSVCNTARKLCEAG